MLTKDDLKDIGKLLNPLQKILDKYSSKLDEHDKRFDRIEDKMDQMKEKLDTNTGSVTNIEKDIKSTLELREDVSQARKQITDHEERITNLEI